MSRALIIRVRFHEGRYHGRPDWPPSPARLFQALVAGAAQGDAIAPSDSAALEWLEQQPAPVIAAPPARAGRTLTAYVPNNDLDTVNGDIGRIAEIRAGKAVRPWLFDAQRALLYVWPLPSDADAAPASEIVRLCDGLFRLGWGLDMAWAAGELVTADDAGKELAAHHGPVYRPCPDSQGGLVLSAPAPGTLASLKARHAETRARLQQRYKPGKPNKANPNPMAPDGITFAQPRKARLASIAYNAPDRVLLFDITGAGAVWPLERVASLVEQVRDRALERLAHTYGAGSQAAASAERTLVGRGAGEADKASRVQIIPLPSIGHALTDAGVRRIAVRVPAGCAVPTPDLEWCFSGLALADESAGEILHELVLAQDRTMLDRHYGVEARHAARVWRSITPVAVPESARRRRVDPTRQRQDAKAGLEMQAEQRAASAAVVDSLRHAGVAASPTLIELQREPWLAKGERAELFARQTRFEKERLWHVRLTFDRPLTGPLVLGDGRYLGLGLMAPANTRRSVWSFTIIDGLAPEATGEQLASALRRAVMARLRDSLGRKPDEGLDRWISGHETNGGKSTDPEHRHLYFAADIEAATVHVFAPEAVRRTGAGRALPDRWLHMLDDALSGLDVVRAGAAGVLRLRPALDVEPARARIWRTITPYALMRHAKLDNAHEAVRLDVCAALAQTGLPMAEIKVERLLAGQSGVRAHLRLSFATAQPGPILLGRTDHKGGGLFAPVRD
jgi:CRISPR-associated protein Csb2